MTRIQARFCIQRQVGHGILALSGPAKEVSIPDVPFDRRHRDKQAIQPELARNPEKCFQLKCCTWHFRTDV
ncbi:hypothetical protein GCM10010038_34440 [Glutamicibacter protophormiae]|nr:hypothetical protein GCM10010038_34440 [Glutamicibacter protophormiae]